MLKVTIDTRETGQKLQELASTLKDARPLFKVIAGILASETEENFAAEGRPHWAPLSRATVKNRLRRNKGGSALKILQDRGLLAASISTDYGADYAMVGSNVAYAAIHQFGGSIHHAARSVRVRLRTDKRGRLLRQGDKGNVNASGKGRAVFAKDSHKQARETWHHAAAWQVNIPARPFLPFYGAAENATLQPETEKTILDAIIRGLRAEDSNQRPLSG
ncbi:MAG: phage virion morphogenesis protein [Zoogloeaceae bacterium]|jgi:phage virion morphogenesis protein|nr:phage virion morphogenesis protein [Zoogloeaceae bacterium]